MDYQTVRTLNEKYARGKQRSQQASSEERQGVHISAKREVDNLIEKIAHPTENFELDAIIQQIAYFKGIIDGFGGA